MMQLLFSAALVCTFVLVGGKIDRTLNVLDEEEAQVEATFAREDQMAKSHAHQSIYLCCLKVVASPCTSECQSTASTIGGTVAMPDFFIMLIFPPPLLSPFYHHYFTTSLINTSTFSLMTHPHFHYS